MALRLLQRIPRILFEGISCPFVVALAVFDREKNQFRGVRGDRSPTCPESMCMVSVLFLEILGSCQVAWENEVRVSRKDWIGHSLILSFRLSRAFKNGSDESPKTVTHGD